MAQNTTQTQNTKLYNFLIENSFYISPQLADIIETVIKTKRKAFLLRGPAGTGKTQLTYLVAQWLNAEYVFFQCTYGTSEDDLLYRYIPSEETKSGIKVTLGPIPRALSISKTRKVVLVLDEFDKTRPSADALLLDVLQNTRISLYLDEKETVVVGNPENLVIFLTSNDMREFSEPLLRRVITITLQPLPPEKVMELLTKRFSKEVALLLTQIYADTINAGLRKPATIQELNQLGEVLEFGTSLPLEDLLRMFIIKYEDDWKKYREYVSTRKAYEIFNFKKHDKKSEEDENISKYYEPPEDAEVEFSSGDSDVATNAHSASTVLEKLKIVVRQPKKIEVHVEINEDVESTFKAVISEEDPKMYTAIVKELEPEPSESGDVMGKFRVVKNDNEINIISKESLKIGEYLKLFDDPKTEFEAYVEDEVVVLSSIINELIKKADKVYYYSSKLLRLEFVKEHFNELIELEMVDGLYSPRAKNSLAKVIVRAYCDVRSYSSYSGRKAMSSLYYLTREYMCRNRYVDLDELEATILLCKDYDDFRVEVHTKPKALIEELQRVAEKHNIRIAIADNLIRDKESVQKEMNLRIKIKEGVIVASYW